MCYQWISCMHAIRKFAPTSSMANVQSLSSSSRVRGSRNSVTVMLWLSGRGHARVAVSGSTKSGSHGNALDTTLRDRLVHTTFNNVGRLQAIRNCNARNAPDTDSPFCGRFNPQLMKAGRKLKLGSSFVHPLQSLPHATHLVDASLSTTALLPSIYSLLSTSSRPNILFHFTSFARCWWWSSGQTQFFFPSFQSMTLHHSVLLCFNAMLPWIPWTWHCVKVQRTQFSGAEAIKMTWLCYFLSQM